MSSPLVTMFTDASWNSKHRRGTWAMWAKLNGHTIRYSGIIKSPMPQSGTAELSAIANGLFVVKSRFDPCPDSLIIVQTDSAESIAALQIGSHNRRQDLELVQYINKMIMDNGWRLDVRHVKAHKGTATRRNAVNTWCDKECRFRMGELLSSLQPSLQLVVDNDKDENYG